MSHIEQVKQRLESLLEDIPPEKARTLKQRASRAGLPPHSLALSVSEVALLDTLERYGACGASSESIELRQSVGSVALPAAVDTRTFFEGIGSSAEQAAVALCQQCPVVDQCLGYALQQNIDYGIWGGTTPNQRKKLQQHGLMKASDESAKNPAQNSKAS